MTASITFTAGQPDLNSSCLSHGGHRSMHWAGLGCCDAGVVAGLLDGKVELANPDDLRTGITRYEVLPQVRDALERVLAAHDARGVSELERIAVGVEAALRLGGPGADRLRDALRALLKA